MATDAVIPTLDFIPIPVTPALAKAYRESPPAEKRRVELFVRFQLESFINSRHRSWEEITLDLSAQAERNGLTEAELQDVLQEWDRDRRR